MKYNACILFIDKFFSAAYLALLVVKVRVNSKLVLIKNFSQLFGSVLFYINYHRFHLLNDLFVEFKQTFVYASL